MGNSFRLFLASVLFLVTSQAFAADIVQLEVRNREATARTNEPITSGIPFAKDVLLPGNPLRLVSDGAEVPAQFLPTAYWPDGSIKWVLSDFQLSLPAASSAFVTVQTGVTPQPINGLTVTASDSMLSVSTGLETLSFDKSEFSLRGAYFEVAVDGVTYRAVPDAASWTVEESGPMKTVLRVDGSWRAGGEILRNTRVLFRGRLVFYRNKQLVRAYVTFKNNNSEGWDPDTGPAQPDITVQVAGFGTNLLPPGSYVFGNGIEKTWEVVSESPSAFQLRDSRYSADGELAPGFTAPRPLAVAPAEYYAGSFGVMGLPVTGRDASSQADFDLYEKLQRAKVRLSDVENPPNQSGRTIWGHMAGDIDNWNRYGGLVWGGDFGPISDNHYDWIYGMYLQFMRTGTLEFVDAARVFAKHEIDFGIYHTNADGAAYNYQKNWESRPSNNSPRNEFGGGRPSHTWVQGYILHWLLTGDPRGKDAYEEIVEGIRQYAYESFNGEGYINTREIRVPGWMIENMVALYRINPSFSFSTTSYGTKTIPQVIKDLLASVLHNEAVDGRGGYVYFGDGDETNHNLRQPLQVCYFIKPAIEAYDEVLKDADPAFAEQLRGLIVRMTDWLMSVTYGGTSNSGGGYMPRQLPYMVDIRKAQQDEGQVPYLLMATDAAAFVYSLTGDSRYRSYARAAFRDYIRYLGVGAGDSYIDISRRTPTAYNLDVYPDTESKIHGWSNRFGQYYLALERDTPLTPDTEAPGLSISSPRAGAKVKSRFTLRGTASDNEGVASVEYRVGSSRTWRRASGISPWQAAVSAGKGKKKVSVTVRATDYSGNVSGEVSRSFKIKK